MLCKLSSAFIISQVICMNIFNLICFVIVAKMLVFECGTSRHDDSVLFSIESDTAAQFVTVS